MSWRPKFGGLWRDREFMTFWSAQTGSEFGDRITELALPLIAMYTRILKEDLTLTLSEEYITVARGKGLPNWYILFRHALRPSVFSLLTLSAVHFGGLVGGTVIVESIFGLPGIGQLLVRAVSGSDFPMVQGIVLVIAVLWVAVNVAVDGCYALLDPRTRRGRP